MLTDQQVAEFNANGYVKGGQVLTDEQVENLRTEMARVIEDRDRPGVKQPVLLRNLSGDDKAPVWQIVNIWEASAPFKELIAHRQIVEEIAQLTHASELRIWHDQIQYKPAHIGGVNMWHQDAPFWPILAPMTEVSAWVALDDVDTDNGCMSMVPGSHLWGNNIDFLVSLPDYEAMPAEYQGHQVKIIRRPVKKGEVHYHHALTWHGSHANTSGRPRRAIALHYMTQDTHYVASGQHVMKEFVTVRDGEIMQGEHFPLVYAARK